MRSAKAVAGDVITKQGDARAESFYIIQSGRYAVTKRIAGQAAASPILTYDGSGSFGELALMYGAPRAATVTCEADGQLWVLDRASFRHAVVCHNAESAVTREGFLKSVNLLAGLTDSQRTSLAMLMEEVVVGDRQDVVRMGEPAEALYFIKAGQVSCHQGAHELIRLGTADFFGESCLQEVSSHGARSACPLHSRCALSSHYCVGSFVDDRWAGVARRCRPWAAASRYSSCVRLTLRHISCRSQRYKRQQAPTSTDA